VAIADCLTTDLTTFFVSLPASSQLSVTERNWSGSLAAKIEVTVWHLSMVNELST
jgi:hypothetical protein